MPPARPRSTKLMKIMISSGRLKNSKIHNNAGADQAESTAVFYYAERNSTWLTSFRENTGRSMAKRDRGFITNLYDLMLTRHNILRIVCVLFDRRRIVHHNVYPSRYRLHPPPDP